MGGIERNQHPSLASPNVQLRGINNRGWISGLSQNPGSPLKSFVLSKETSCVVSNPGYATTTVAHVSDNGYVTGVVTNGDPSDSHQALPYILRKRQFIILPDQAGASSHFWPTGINTNAEVVGYTRFGSPPDIAVEHAPGGYSFVLLPTSTPASYANDINNFGQVVGSYYDSFSGQGQHGFIADAVSAQSYNVPGATSGTTAISGNNDAGDIVGTYNVPGSSIAHSFMLRGGAFSEIAFPGASDTIVTDVNNADDVVGFYYRNGVSGSFGFKASLAKRTSPIVDHSAGFRCPGA